MEEGWYSSGEAAYWEPRPDGCLVCALCPHHCVLKPGAWGLCRVRRAVPGPEGARLSLPHWGAISSLAVDPIEKKPLHHFLPGSSVFSAGFVGCNLRCPFCQNWEISQDPDAAARRLDPEELVAAALESGAPSIAYTYSEPVVHFEFVRDCMRLARAGGLRNVLVTNGCLEEAPARELLALCDAANVDLKCWSAEDYSRRLGGNLDAVKTFIALAAESCHLEVTTLVVPGLSDADGDIAEMSVFLSAISPDIPWHLSAYHPAWKESVDPTDPALLSRLASLARLRLSYVYTGNLPGGRADSACPSCGAILVRRRLWKTEILGLEAMAPPASGVRCRACSRALPFTLGEAGVPGRRSR